MSKRLIVCVLLLLVSGTVAALILVDTEKTHIQSVVIKKQIEDGSYIFSHRFAEHPNMQSINLNAVIEEGTITLTNDTDSEIFPKGIIEKGLLFWHVKSSQWIIVVDKEDKDALDVGGCSDGPEVVDLENKIYWTC